MGPPSAGGIAIVQMLGMIERFDMKALGKDDPRAWHLIAEAMRLAYADRDLYLADGDFVSIPIRGLTDPNYLAARGKLISPTTAMPTTHAGTPPGVTMALAKGSEPPEVEIEGRSILLDTSVIIDGRIADVSRTGFLQGSLLIPRFVLNELQYIADSPDSLRRQRGRRGMEVLSSLQKEPLMPVNISDMDVEGVREVDEKLVVLARQMRCPILTNDYNLNRVAELQGVQVLNINELANAVKAILIPGEQMTVQVIQEGREAGQGVAYMEDGTMVVVENGRDYMDKTIQVVVTKVLQTAAGRMIFARPLDLN